MRHFSCFTRDEQHTVSAPSFIIAGDEFRARFLARRELMDTPHAISVEICEGGKLLWIENLS